MNQEKQIAKEYQEKVFVKSEYLSDWQYKEALEKAVLYGIEQGKKLQKQDKIK